MARNPNNNEKSRIIEIPVGTKLAYRIFGGDYTLQITISQEEIQDWSGFYAQFTVEHCLSYLPNRYD